MAARFELPPTEFFDRVERFRSTTMREKNLAGAVIFGASRVFYLGGFHHLPTERPVALVIPADGDLALLVPHLEEENIPVRTPWIKKTIVYREYPGKKHPMLYLADYLKANNLSGRRLGVDSDGYGAYWGYRGPRLSEIVDCTAVPVGDEIDRMKMIKSETELALIRESARWGNLAHTYLQEYVEIGRTELEISLRASTDATIAMMGVAGPDFEPMGWGTGATANFTSGPKTSFNHRRAGARRIRRGDMLLTGASAGVGGYKSELERMLVVGEPTAEIKKYFQLEVEAQDIAFEAIRPGNRCSDVEKAVNEFLESHGILDMTRTHIGHGLGIDVHEAPFLDVGDDTVIEPGMVLSVEPCLFIPGVAGFRHSDTVVVTATGNLRITYYPRDLDSLVIPV